MLYIPDWSWISGWAGPPVSYPDNFISINYLRRSTTLLPDLGFILSTAINAKINFLIFFILGSNFLEKKGMPFVLRRFGKRILKLISKSGTGCWTALLILTLELEFWQLLRPKNYVTAGESNF